MHSSWIAPRVSDRTPGTGTGSCTASDFSTGAPCGAGVRADCLAMLHDARVQDSAAQSARASRVNQREVDRDRQRTSAGVAWHDDRRKARQQAGSGRGRGTTPGGAARADYRAKALKMYPWICGRCTREFTRENLRELTVHHRDHDHDNNPPDGSNWELLCVYCHDNEHARFVDHVRGAGYERAPTSATPRIDRLPGWRPC